MRILFINPSLRLGSPTKYLPVGIGSVMTFVRDHGFEFDLLDVDINDISNENVEKFISEHEYDVILTGCIVTHYKWVKWLTRTIRQYHPRAKIVVGNSVAGSIPELFLRNSAADVAVTGEGEFTALEVLKAFEKGTSLAGVEGITFRSDSGDVIKNAKRPACKIDDLPLVDWDLFDVDRYFAKSYSGGEGLVYDEETPPRVMPVATARGCVFKCTFCHYVFWDDPYRHRSPESILAEISRNITKYGATYINFWDDLSFSTLRQAEAIADAILASGLKFNWNAAIRTDLFGNPKIPRAKRVRVAEKFLESGCLNVGFSLESGNQAILNMMQKHIKPEYFFDQVQILKEVGITCSTSVVFGYPIETPETIKETFDMCLRAGVYPSIGFLLPLPYTGMYDYGKEHGFIPDENAYLDSITERQDICLNMTQMPSEQVMQLIKDGASELNKRLDLNLEADRLIKTGGYRRHTKKTASQDKKRLDPENMSRTENDVSFNYSQAIFDIELGTDKQAKRTALSLNVVEGNPVEGGCC